MYVCVCVCVFIVTLITTIVTILSFHVFILPSKLNKKKIEETDTQIHTE